MRRRLRFVLDSDVDESGCRRALESAGQEVLTARAAQVHDDDRDVAAYAISRKAIVVTQDSEFTVTHKGKPIGSHVRLTCPPPAEEAVLTQALPELIPLLSRHELITVLVSSVQLKVYFPDQPAPQKIPLPSQRLLPKAIRRPRRPRRRGRTS